MSKSPLEGAVPKPEDAAIIAKVVENANLERRITSLEGSITRLENSLLDRHARLITIIFSCISAFVAVCAILVTVLGLYSKSESSQATRDMEEKVDKATGEMERKFETLAGEALKKPLLQISTPTGPLDGHIFDTNLSPIVMLGPIFFENTGDKATDTVSTRLYCSTNIFLTSGDWQIVASNDRDYPFSWYLKLGSIVAQKETWTAVNSLDLQPLGSTSNLNFKLLVYYGGANPAKADFQVKIKR